MDPLAFSVAVDIDRTEEVWTFRDGPLMAEEDAKAYAHCLVLCPRSLGLYGGADVRFVHLLVPQFDEHW